MSSSRVWVPSKSQGWILGNLIQDMGDGNFSVIAEGSDKLFAKADVFRSDPSHFEVLDDLCSMNYLSEAPLLDSLRRRFAEDAIYTNAGDVLISVNPYKFIKGMYDNPLNFLDVPEDGDVSSLAAKPHVFKIANIALLQLMLGQRLSVDELAPVNQSIVVSGESGAGKTEASKHVMNFLIAADIEILKDKNDSTQSTLVQDQLGDATRQVLVRSNIIFESFGNAKTVRNDNSSRFGKYIKLQYTDENRILSAYTETFLLEKSRLMSVGANERTYHVFYQLLKSKSRIGMLHKLHLSTSSDFRMLQDMEGKVLSSSQDDLFNDLENALRTVGCTEVEIEGLWQVLAALLHLGNLTCHHKEEKQTTETDQDDSTALHDDNTQHIDGNVEIKSPSIPLHHLADLLGVTSENFASRLTTQKVKVSTRRSVTVKSLNIIDVNNNIAALIKWVYSCVFSWLVSKVNYAHCNVGSRIGSMATKFIGILDIFGFEILQTNSFEQLCINYTNERLQQQFNEYVFDREQDIYKTEGLDWTSIQYKDNQHVIDLIGKKPLGLLPILEQQGMLNRGSVDEAALIAAFNQSHDKNTTAYEKSRFGSDFKFTVKHFAGDVTYTVTGFLEKNNDSLQEDLMELMVCSSNSFIHNAVVCVGMGEEGNESEPGYVSKIDPSKIVQSAGNLSMAASVRAADPNPTKKIAATGRRGSLLSADGGSKKLATFVTVSFQFRSQLDILVSTLRATSPHYIKCIKPNALKCAGTFDGALVLEQLRYSGALEVVRIRQEGYPVCLRFAQFYEQFERLAFKRNWLPPSQCTEEQALEYTRTLCTENLKLVADYQLGHNKVFLKSESYEKMHFAVEAFLGKKVRKFQALIRKVFASRKYRTSRKGIIMLQKYVRMNLCVQRYRKLMAQNHQAREMERQRIAEKIRQERLRYEKRVQDLHGAAVNGDYELVVKCLTANPEDFEVRNSQHNNCTVMMSAAFGGNIEIIKYLNPSVEDLWARDALGNTALHYAVMGLSATAVDVLRVFAIIASISQGSDLHGEYEEEKPTVRPLSTKIRAVKEEPVTLEEVEPVVNSAPIELEGVMELRSGWLSKRGESNIWRKRWVKLTSEALMYFRNPKDKVPRDTLLFTLKNDIRIERSPQESTAIDIFINHQSAKKKRDRVSLMAETEQEMQIWMSLIKAAAGVESKPLRSVATSSEKKVKPLKVMIRNRTKKIFKQVNANKDSLLHILCYSLKEAQEKGEKGGMSLDQALILCAYLLYSGCPMESFNAKGLTPLHIAEEGGLLEVASLLTRDEGDTLSRNVRRSLYINPNVEFQLELKKIYEEFPEQQRGIARFLPPPLMLRGFHYLSATFYSSFQSFYSPLATGEKLFLKVSAFNRNDLLVEAPQFCPLFLQRPPSSESGPKLLWLDTFYLQFPLDNVDDQAYLLIEMLKRGAQEMGQGAVLASCRRVLERETVNTELLSLEMTDSSDTALCFLSVELSINKKCVL